VTHGWTPRFEAGAFIETAPVVPAHGTRFGGGHIRPKIRLLEMEHVPLKIGLVAEYGFNRVAFDENRQTIRGLPVSLMPFNHVAVRRIIPA